MDIFINILIFLHIFGLVLGLGSGMANSRIGPMLVTADEGQRSLLASIVQMLSKNGHVGLGLLWVTGLLVVWLKYGGAGGFDNWFWAKMVFVVVLSASVGMSGAAARKLKAGDMSVLPLLKRVGMVSGLSALVAVLCAVFAFH